jgi:hypothetical protein
MIGCDLWNPTWLGQFIATATPEVRMMSRYRPHDTTHWRHVKPEWRSSPGNSLPLAFTYLKKILSAEEYERMVREYRDGRRDIRIDNEFIVTCFVPDAHSRR